MRQRIHSMLASALVLTLGLSVAAVAQSEIALSGGEGQTVIFSGQGAGSSSLGASLGSCNMAGLCALTGDTAGYGSMQSSGTFALASVADAVMLASNSGGLGVSASSPIDLAVNGTFNGRTGSLLTGSLNLVNFDQASGSSTGEFNTTLGANFTVTGGLRLPALSTESGGNATAVAASPSPMPEPSTLALMGAGLLILGGLIRRYSSSSSFTA